MKKLGNRNLKSRKIKMNPYEYFNQGRNLDKSFICNFEHLRFNIENDQVFAYSWDNNLVERFMYYRNPFMLNTLLPKLKIINI